MNLLYQTSIAKREIGLGLHDWELGDAIVDGKPKLMITFFPCSSYDELPTYRLFLPPSTKPQSAVSTAIRAIRKQTLDAFKCEDLS